MQRLCRFERYKNNTSAERGAVKSPGSSDEAFSPDEVEIVSLIRTNPRWLDEDNMLDEDKMLDEDNIIDEDNLLQLGVDPGHARRSRLSKRRADREHRRRPGHCLRWLISSSDHIKSHCLES